MARRKIRDTFTRAVNPDVTVGEVITVLQALPPEALLLARTGRLRFGDPAASLKELIAIIEEPDTGSDTWDWP